MVNKPGRMHYVMSNDFYKFKTVSPQIFRFFHQKLYKSLEYFLYMTTPHFKDKGSSCMTERRPLQELFEQDKEPLPKISKKALETIKNKNPNDWLSRLIGSAKLKKFTTEEQEHWFDNYESVDTSNIFREHGLD